MEAGGPADGSWGPEAAACSGGPAPVRRSVWVPARLGSGLGCGCGRGDSFPGGNRAGGYGPADGCCVQGLPTKAEAGGLADGLWIPGAAACSGGPAPVRRSVGVPARVWAVASGEATAFRAVIGLEVTGRRMVAVCRGCRRRRRLEDRRTGRGGLKRLRAAEVRVPARVWARSGLRLRAELSDRGKAAPGCAKQGGVVAARMEYPRSCGMGRRAASEGRKTERVKATGTTKKPTVA